MKWIDRIRQHGYLVLFEMPGYISRSLTVLKMNWIYKHAITSYRPAH